MGENGFAATPTALYGVVLLMAAIAYFILQPRASSAARGGIRCSRAPSAATSRASSRWCCYAVAIPLALLAPWASLALYWIVAAMWLVPDRRIEKVVLACEDERRAEGRSAG